MGGRTREGQHRRQEAILEARRRQRPAGGQRRREASALAVGQPGGQDEARTRPGGQEATGGRRLAW